MKSDSGMNLPPSLLTMDPPFKLATAGSVDVFVQAYSLFCISGSNVSFWSSTFCLLKAAGFTNFFAQQHYTGKAPGWPAHKGATVVSMSTTPTKWICTPQVNIAQDSTQDSSRNQQHYRKNALMPRIAEP
jgi:hypothetical protein